MAADDRLEAAILPLLSERRTYLVHTNLPLLFSISLVHWLK
jgi:hypothetical protein